MRAVNPFLFCCLGIIYSINQFKYLYFFNLFKMRIKADLTGF